jgi:hypothetical protein
MRLKEQKFEVSLGYIARSCIRKRKKKSQVSGYLGKEQ